MKPPRNIVAVTDTLPVRMPDRPQASSSAKMATSDVKLESIALIGRSMTRAMGIAKCRYVWHRESRKNTRRHDGKRKEQ